MIGQDFRNAKIIHLVELKLNIKGATVSCSFAASELQMTTFTDPYASSQETTEGRVYSVTGGDWDSLVTEIGATKEERVV